MYYTAALTARRHDLMTYPMGVLYGGAEVICTVTLLPEKRNAKRNFDCRTPCHISRIGNRVHFQEVRPLPSNRRANTFRPEGLYISC